MVCHLIQNRDFTKLDITNEKNIENLDSLRLLKEVTKNYPELEDIKKAYERDGKNLFLIKFKLCIFKYLKGKQVIPEMYDETYTKIKTLFKKEQKKLEKEHIDKIHNDEIIAAQLAERDKILANLAHSIKNLISSVQTPLQLVAGDDELAEYNKFSVDNALKGLELIKRLAFSVDHSYTGAIEDFIFDAKCKADEGQSIEELILSSLIYATGNMFDRKYFEKTSFRYFPKGAKEQRLAAKKAYDETINNLDFEKVSQMLNDHFFNFSYEVDATVENRLNDTKSSATKFFIMLQEIIMNAVKYASFTPREQRFMKITVKTVGEQVVIEVKNSMKLSSKEKTTGMGHVVIANITKMLDGTSEMKRNVDDEAFETKISFNNLWADKILNYHQPYKNIALKVAEAEENYKN
jgi:two-component sensor histidine kinase